ncbi:hypothetical protein N7414_23065 [Pseudomonas sp. GD04087]|uniref:hypothetical protein n=1 Tax=unclassified Pseudomonas TaxID=196821 RepID=UPI00244B4C33|nr:MULTISPECIES: hypothetical protein [unclassified Pseudomonas]MDH0292015.1 hypothetical protein [Pseudomonas sp. GD04087]MDH1052863.1 hypothetical protein [Pseudomonas sp. GD03903]MDH2002026.1 hypothetical protein [Pseudomonas sp. GD03691]
MSWHAVRHRYKSFWDEAYSLFRSVSVDLPTGTIDACEIGDRELAEADAWLNHPDRIAGWNWRAVLNQERKSHKRFEAAFWVDGVLCGLMVCRVSKRRINLSVRFIEGAPFQHPLRGQLLQVAIIQAELFASVIGATQVAIIKPLEGVAERYIALGYQMEYGDRSKVSKGLKPRFDQLIKHLKGF